MLLITVCGDGWEEGRLVLFLSVFSESQLNTHTSDGRNFSEGRSQQTAVQRSGELVKNGKQTVKGVSSSTCPL
jgi:hypothetical protein